MWMSIATTNNSTLTACLIHLTKRVTKPARCILRLLVVGNQQALHSKTRLSINLIPRHRNTRYTSIHTAHPLSRHPHGRERSPIQQSLVLQLATACPQDHDHIHGFLPPNLLPTHHSFIFSWKPRPVFLMIRTRGHPMAQIDYKAHYSHADPATAQTPSRHSMPLHQYPTAHTRMQAGKALSRL